MTDRIFRAHLVDLKHPVPTSLSKLSDQVKDTLRFDLLTFC